MKASSDLERDLLHALPHLRAFAISLCGSVEFADDLVQEAVLKGLTKLDQFEAGTNLQAWLFTILRNLFYTGLRRRRREVEDPDGLMAARLAVLPEQHAHLDFGDLGRALAKLPAHQREVLVLIGAEGLSYEEAAQVCGANVGTIKSRMNRARARLAELLEVSDEEDFGADRQFKGVTATDPHQDFARAA
jgi:RNA polymerase sigma-70 factor (ECF subfamily)